METSSKKWLQLESVSRLLLSVLILKKHVIAKRKWYEHHVVARWMCLTVHLANACVLWQTQCTAGIIYIL